MLLRRRFLQPGPARLWPIQCLFAAWLAVVTQPGLAVETDREKQLQTLKETIRELRKQLEATKTSRDEVNETLEKAEKNISDLSKKARAIEAQLEERQRKLDRLREERSQLNEKKRTQEGLVGDYLNAAYRLGQQSNLRLLLNQEDAAQVSRNLKYYDYLVAARAEKIGEYMATIGRINEIEPAISRQAELIREDFERLDRQRQQLRGVQRERTRLLAKLDARIHSQDQKLRLLLEDRRQLEKLLSTVIENIADIRPRGNTARFSSLKGKLPWPTKGRVIKKFGSSRVANKMRWEGLLIASNEGEAVRAVHYGRVVFSDYLRGHGLLIILDHGAGYMSLYAHNQTLNKELGEWVESGEAIASVGRSGGQQDTALYFELRYRGKPTNPQQWFRRA